MNQKAIALSSGALLRSTKVCCAVLELRHVVIYTPCSVRLAPRHFASSRRFLASASTAEISYD